MNGFRHSSKIWALACVFRAGADVDRLLQLNVLSVLTLTGRRELSVAYGSFPSVKKKKRKGNERGEGEVDRLFHLNFLTLSDFWFMARSFPCTLLNSVDIQYLKGSQFFPGSSE